MSLSNATKFLNDVSTDKDFRYSLYDYNSQEELFDYLNNNGYAFDLDELEEAYTSAKVRCQFEEQADMLTQVYNMSRMMLVIA